MGDLDSIGFLAEYVIAHRAPALPKRVRARDLEQILSVVHRHAHDDPSLRALLELKPYDFEGTDNLWVRKGQKDYALAREMMHAFVQKLLLEKRWTFVEFVQNITQRTLFTTPLNEFGTTLCGMVSRVYGCRYQDAIIDLVAHDERYREYRDLTLDDFKKKAKWTTEEARDAVHRATLNLMRANRWRFKTLIKNLDKTLLQAAPISRYKTLKGVLGEVYQDSPERALIDLVTHDLRHRNHTDLRTYDFDQVRNKWLLKDGTKNVSLAREMTDALVKRLRSVHDWTVSDVFEKTSYRIFTETPVNRYGTTCQGMVKRVYDSSPLDALRDWYNHHPRMSEMREKTGPLPAPLLLLVGGVPRAQPHTA